MVCININFQLVLFNVFLKKKKFLIYGMFLVNFVILYNYDEKRNNILYVLMGLLFFVLDMNYVIEIYDFFIEFKIEDLFFVFFQFK